MLGGQKTLVDIKKYFVSVAVGRDGDGIYPTLLDFLVRTKWNL